MRIFSYASEPEKVETRSYNPSWMQAVTTAIMSSNSTSVVNENLALTVAAVYSAVKLLSELPASLPAEHLKLENGYFKVNQAGPLAEVLRRPNSFQTGFTFYQSMLMQMHLRGNSFAFIKKTAEKIELIPVYNHYVEIKVSPDGDEVFYSVNGQSFASDEFLHFKGLSTDGIIGLSPIQYAQRTLSNAVDAEKYQNKVYESGITASGFFQTAERLSDKVYNRVKKDIEEKSGVDRAGEALLLEQGLKFERNTLSAIDAGILQQMDFSVEQIARIYRVPKHLLYLESSGGSTRSFSISAREFLTYTLTPLLGNIESELEKKLFTHSQEFQNSNQIRFDTKSLLRADPIERSEYYQNLFNIGSLTPNEIRSFEGLPPIPGADESFVQLNLAPISKIEQVIDDKINKQIDSTNG